MTSSTPHPTDEILLAFRRAPDTLEAAQRDEVSAHLAECAPCRDAVGAVVSLDLESLLADSAAAETATPATKTGESLTDRIRGLFEPPAPVWAALAAAALLLAFGIPWLASQGPEPEVPIAQREKPVASEPEFVPPSEAAVEVASPTPEPEPIIESPAPAAPVEEMPVGPDPESQIAQTEVVPPLPAPPSEPPRVPKPAAPRRTETVITSFGYDPVLFKKRAGLPLGRVTAATRGAGAATAQPVALTPEHVGLTLDAQPRLYFFLPESTTAGLRVDVSDLDAMQTVLSKSLPGPFRAGVHALRLADHGVRLTSAHNYQWTLTPAGADAPTSGGIVRRIAPDAAQKAALATASPADRVRSLAKEGIWYDALELLSRSIDARPKDAALRNGRAQLLEQVGLDSAAAWDRRGS